MDSSASTLSVAEGVGDEPPPYHRRAGDTDGGGLDMVLPVAGLMIGIGLRARVAGTGWYSFRVDGCCWLWEVGGKKAGEVELSRNTGAAWTGCEGECSGELLARDDRSEDALWMETSWERGSVHVSPGESKECRAANANKGAGLATTLDLSFKGYSRRSRSTSRDKTRGRPRDQRTGRPRTWSGTWPR